MALSMAMQDVLPFLNLMKKMQELLPMNKDDPNVFARSGKTIEAASKWMRAQSLLHAQITLLLSTTTSYNLFLMVMSRSIQLISWNKQRIY